MSTEWARELEGECDHLEPHQVLPLVPDLDRLIQAQDLPQEARLLMQLLWATGFPWRKLDRLRWGADGLQANDRPVPLDPKTLRWLRQWAGDSQPGPALGPYLTQLPKWLAQAAEPLQILSRFQSCQRQLTPQVLRHSFAVRSLEAGMDLLVLSKLLDHHQLFTTQNYIAVAMADCQRAYLASHPLVHLPKTTKAVKQPQACPSIAETLALIDAPKLPRDRLILRLLYATALRVSELLALVSGDIDERGRLFVRTAKGEQDRYALLDPHSLQRLQQYAQERPPGQRLFATTRAHVHTLTVRAARQLGLLQKYQALGLSLSPHSFRHACASHCYQQAMPVDMVRKMLGHADLRNTLLYIDWPVPQMHHQFQLCHPWTTTN